MRWLVVNFPSAKSGSAGADKRGRGALERLRVYRRVHVRLTAIYGAALLLVLTPAAVVKYWLGRGGLRVDVLSGGEIVRGAGFWIAA